MLKSRVRNYHQLAVTCRASSVLLHKMPCDSTSCTGTQVVMQGFLRTPWNATSRTTAQDALWQHILYRNTSSQPFMTPCARQVLNRIPGNVTPPEPGAEGRSTHAQWAEQDTFVILPFSATVNFQQSRPCWIQLCHQCVLGLTFINLVFPAAATAPLYCLRWHKSYVVA